MSCEGKGANSYFWVDPLGRQVSGAKRGSWKSGRFERKGYFKLNRVKEIQVGVQLHISVLMLLLLTVVYCVRFL